jgi:hypothetical protein
MNKVIKGRKTGEQWRMMGRLEDLDCAVEICLLVPRWSEIKAKLVKLKKEAAKVELTINEFQTKETRVNPGTYLVLTINGRKVEEIKFFMYLGSIVTMDGGARRGCPEEVRKANGALLQLYPFQRNKKILELKFNCLIQMLSHSYRTGVNRGK